MSALAILGLAGPAALAGAEAASAATTGPSPITGRSPPTGRGPGHELLVRIGSAPKLLPGAIALGRVPGPFGIEFDVALRPRDPAQLARFATAVSTPGSRLFHQYLHPGAFGAAFGPSFATVRATTEVLRRLGLHVDSVSGNRLVIRVSSTAATIDRAFSTTLVRYRLRSGPVVYANRSAPLVPAVIAKGIQAIIGLSDLARLRPVGLARPIGLASAGAAPRSRPSRALATGGPMPCSALSLDASDHGAYTADELASAYGFSGLYTAGDLGAGATVAIFELEPDLPTDIAAYQACYGTAASVNYVQVDSGSGPGPGSGEAALDIEDVIGLAPAATIDVYQGPDNATGPLDVYNAIVTQDKAQVITTSWGACEAQVGGARS